MFEYIKGDIYSTTQWNRPQIDNFLLFVKNEMLPLPQEYQIYLWGSFPETNNTWDVDLTFIGEPTKYIRDYIVNLEKVSLDKYKQLLDIRLQKQFTGIGPVWRHYDKIIKNGEVLTDRKNQVKERNGFYREDTQVVFVKNKRVPIVLDDFLKNPALVVCKLKIPIVKRMLLKPWGKLYEYSDEY